MAALITASAQSASRTLWFTLLLPAFIGSTAFAQVPADSDGYPVEYLGQVDDSGLDASATAPVAYAAEGEQRFSDAELQDLVGPVALYPDDLLAIVLPASTYPLEIVQAARFLDAYELDSSLEPDEDWDESVVALLNYPEVLRMLDDDIDWTWQLGDAVINQQNDVIGAIEGFRDRAYAAGNLKSDQYQTVTEDEGIIEIIPIDDDVIYVPYYEPHYVVERQPQPVYHYYPAPRPVYYYPYPVGHAFSSGYFWGVTTAFRIGWSHHYLTVHHPSYWGHPYFGRSYYGHYYRRPSITVYNTTYVNNTVRTSRNRHRDGDYWRPRQSSYVQRTSSYRRSGETRRAHTVDYRNSVSSRDSSSRNNTARRESNRSDIRFRERPATASTNTTRNGTRSSTNRDARDRANNRSGSNTTRSNDGNRSSGNQATVRTEQRASVRQDREPQPRTVQQRRAQNEQQRLVQREQTRQQAERQPQRQVQQRERQAQPRETQRQERQAQPRETQQRERQAPRESRGSSQQRAAPGVTQRRESQERRSDRRSTRK